MRLFLAVDLPEDVRAELRALAERLQHAGSGWRWVRPEGVHLTMRFLGEVRDEHVETQSRLWREIAAACTPATVEIGGVGAFPTPSRPRVLWVGVRETEPGEALRELASRLEEGARAVGFAAEERAFSPHLTLARAEQGARPSVPVGAPPRALHLRVEELTLFRSRIERGGARYTALERYRLGGGA